MEQFVQLVDRAGVTYGAEKLSVLPNMRDLGKHSVRVGTALGMIS